MAGARCTRDCLRFSLWFMFGTTSWIGVTALFAQASYFILVLPEGYRIFAWVDAAMESGNIVPALLIVLLSEDRLVRYHRPLALAVAGTAVGTMLLLALSWHSTALLLFGSWFTGAVGSTAMLVYFVLASSHGPDAVSATSVGIGACGLVTNVLGIAQGLPHLKEERKSCHQLPSTRNSTRADLAAADPASALAFGPTPFFLAVAAWVCLGIVSLCVIARGGRNVTYLNQLHEALRPDVESGGSSEDTTNGTRPRGNSSAGKLERRSGEYLHGGIGFLRRRAVSIARAAGQYPGPLAAIAVSCLTEFAMPSLIPYLLPCGRDHASLSFWLTLCYLTGSMLGRMATSLVHCRRFTLLNLLQTGFFLYALVGARAAVPPPVVVSMVLATIFSFLHGYIVTEVFLSFVKRPPQLTALCGLSNQFGALLGSLFTFGLVQAGIIVKRECGCSAVR